MSHPLPTSTAAALEQGTYEILRARLRQSGDELRARLDRLNAARQEVFGSIKSGLVATDRVTTKNNCLSRDLIPIGENRFLFGYNVHLGLRTETQLNDVFAIYEYRDHSFHELPLTLIGDEQFEYDFKALYRYYRGTVFAKFSQIGPHLFMEFRTGRSLNDFKTFKWLSDASGLRYLGNRFDHEYVFPPQHEFEWTRTHRELHRAGLYPHISVEDRIFVECVGGDLTIKVEDNTDSGQGVYVEPVEHRDQTLDDAEIYYASVGNLILLKVRPYQEQAFRYIVFNEKMREARRIDAVADSCVLLPDDHGIIFANGYYLQSGEFRQFETQLTDMRFYKRIVSPNGEDILFSFYNRESGEYVLLSYSRIARQVDTPLICGGFSIFASGEMAIFRNAPEPQKHHVIQVWQTPYVGESWQPPVKSTSFLYKVGNPAVVGAMAECNELLTLIGKDDSFAGLYLDLVKRSTDILDSYFWLDHAEASDLRTPLAAIKDAAAAALAEFDKVAAIKKNTAAETQRLLTRVSALMQSIPAEAFETIEKFVASLAEVRALRGELISLKELRYVDLTLVEKTEQELIAAGETLVTRTVQFLLQPRALTPLSERVEALKEEVAALPKVAEAEKHDLKIQSAAKDLDLLVETVGSLKIQDATETARIIESIGAIYAVLNQARAALKQRVRELRGKEAVAEFNSQNSLLDQALANYLDLSDSPERCDEFLNRLLVQVEELEARFADFEEFVVELAEKRTAFSGAFEQRKLELVETRNRKASGLLAAAERILKGIRHRAEHVGNPDELNSYFAADAMVEKVRDITQQLIALGDTNKADDVASRLKSIREDSRRQLKDRQDLFAGGVNTIQLGRHQFLVNTQALDLTIVPRGEALALHITGTAFFRELEDAEIAATKALWNLEVSSETSEVYRAEWLAWVAFRSLESDGRIHPAKELTAEELSLLIAENAGKRLHEGYVKGVHDRDAAGVLAAFLKLHANLGLLRYRGSARAFAGIFWMQGGDDPGRKLLAAKLHGMGAMRRVFAQAAQAQEYVQQLESMLRDFIAGTGLFDAEMAPDAARFVMDALQQEGPWPVSASADELLSKFAGYLRDHHCSDAFQNVRNALGEDVASQFELARLWLRGFASVDASADVIDEAAWQLVRGTKGGAIEASASVEVKDLLGSHPKIVGGKFQLEYHGFVQRMTRHERDVLPACERLAHLKRERIAAARSELRLEGFRPQVLTSFVRNRLIDSAYLPLIGDNLAKQIGAAGDAKRTDRMGLLLLISPPGYGKTTLVEYVANRLGMTFVKVNGPAIGHRVTSLDPAEAPNAAARDELNKLNLAFEMGDNVMLCLDDIQHLNPEFLQKFISLCDGSRRVEGVYRGQPRTYDLRGRKIAVVMAGNPYTESGDKFRLPDMLANRADTYNLGDVIGAHADAFRASYLENAAGSNPTLERVVARQPKDLQALLAMAEERSENRPELEGNWAPQEIEEFLSVLRKLRRVRDVVLRVNEEYIRSAAQADAYRTEPAFKLQGSYRNMNRLAEKIAPVMNDAELEELIASYYRNEAQTLTSGAEANLLKFRELIGTLAPEESTRWEDIKRTFRKNHLLGAGGDDDPVNRVVQRLSAMFDGIDGIKEVLAAGLAKPPVEESRKCPVIIVTPPKSNGQSEGKSGLPADWTREVAITQDTLQKIWALIEEDRPKPE